VVAGLLDGDDSLLLGNNGSIAVGSVEESTIIMLVGDGVILGDNNDSVGTSVNEVGPEVGAEVGGGVVIIIVVVEGDESCPIRLLLLSVEDDDGSLRRFVTITIGIIIAARHAKKKSNTMIQKHHLR